MLTTPRSRGRKGRGKGDYSVKLPVSLASAKSYLEKLSLTPLSMVRLCPTCHRFITGAPEPSLDHSEGASGHLCVLPHHPPPCPGTDRHGNPCQIDENRVPVSDDDVPVTTPGGSIGQQLDVRLLQQQLETVQRERDEE